MPSFRDYDDPKRTDPYGWDFSFKFPGDKTLKRHYPTFKTKKAKAEFKTEFEKKFYSDRDSFLTFDKRLYTRFLAWEQKLISLGVTFDQLINHHENHKPRHNSVTIQDAITQIIAIKTKEEFTGLRHFKLHLSRFMEHLSDPDRRVDMIDSDEVQDWIDYLELDMCFGHKTVKNHIKHLRMVFNREKNKRRLEHSPADFLSIKEELGDQEPETMDVADVIKLLRWCEANDPSLGGLLGLQFFSGLRVSVVGPELAKQKKDGQFTLDMIDFKNQTLTIPAKLMKKKKRLFNQTISDYPLPPYWDGLPPCIWHWLNLIDEKDCTLNKTQFNERREQACWKAGVKWVKNGPRHSFGTYYSVLKGSNDKAAQIMAVETSSIFLRNYQGVRDYDEAVKYFEIYPENCSQDLVLVKFNQKFSSTRKSESA